MKDKIKIVVKKILFNNRSIINFLKKNVNFIYVRERDKYSFKKNKIFYIFRFQKVVILDTKVMVKNKVLLFHGQSVLIEIVLIIMELIYRFQKIL